MGGASSVRRVSFFPHRENNNSDTPSAILTLAVAGKIHHNETLEIIVDLRLFFPSDY